MDKIQALQFATGLAVFGSYVAFLVTVGCLLKMRKKYPPHYTWMPLIAEVLHVAYYGERRKVQR